MIRWEDTIQAAKDALEEQFNRAHDDDWSAADADRFDRDKVMLDEHLENLNAILADIVNEEHIPAS